MIRTLTQRIASERAKAIEKYGDNALRPEGNPDKDIIDHTINELVGLIRYGEMLMYRYPTTEIAHIGKEIAVFGVEQANRLLHCLTLDGSLQSQGEKERAYEEQGT